MGSVFRLPIYAFHLIHRKYNDNVHMEVFDELVYICIYEYTTKNKPAVIFVYMFK